MRGDHQGPNPPRSGVGDTAGAPPGGDFFHDGSGSAEADADALAEAEAEAAYHASLAAPSIETRLLEMVLRIAQRAALHTDGVMQWTYEISLPQLLVMRALAAADRDGRGPLSVSDVATTLGCSRANASELATSLVMSRHLAKTRDPANGRIVRLRLTVVGLMAEYRARGVVANCACQVFATIGPSDKEILAALLENVTFR